MPVKHSLDARVKTTEEFRPGTLIIEQGKEDRGFYVLESGSVEVFKDDMLLNVMLFPGTIFGELSDILDKPRTCTVKARTPTTVTKYSASSMEAIIQEHPDIALKIFKTLAGRVERTTQKLADISHSTMFWSTE